MAASRSIQLLCRAAFSLCNVASPSALTAAPATHLAASGGRWAAGGGVQQAAVTAGSLRQLLRHFHSSLGLRVAEAGTPGINPLQQAPTPTAAATGESPLGGGAPAFTIGEPATSSRAVARGIAMSPQKLNDFAKVVRGLSLEDALIQCRMSCKKSAKLVHTALLSARSNAVNNHGLDEARLRVAEAWVGKGTHLKRVSMHGRGRSGRRLRYRCHLTVVLREEEEEIRRRVMVVPMLAERHKPWRQRAATGPPTPQ